jgi:class 3 adenylate cyclase
VQMATFAEALSRFARVVLFDRRGTGLSDPVPLTSLPTMETWVEDLVAVLDAVGVRDCVVAASDLAVTTAILFAAIHPDRTSALILVNGTARVRRADDYPAGIPDQLVEPFLDSIERGWGTDTIAMDIIDPSVVDDREQRRWWSRYQRATASPGTMAAMTRVLIDTDVRAALSAIVAPTLVVHRAEDAYLRVGHGRYLAEHIRNATMVELPGADHSPEVGDIEDVLTAMARFVTGHDTPIVLDRVLRTVLFTDIVGSTHLASAIGDDKWLDLIQRHHEVTRRQLARFGGTEIKSTGDGMLATFEGPARAIRCALSTRDAVTSLGISIRAGIHSGEIEYVSGDIVGIGVHIAARVLDVAAPDEVLVTRTVTELVAGSGIVFEDRGTHPLKGVAQDWRLLAAISA